MGFKDEVRLDVSCRDGVQTGHGVIYAGLSGYGLQKQGTHWTWAVQLGNVWTRTIRSLLTGNEEQSQECRDEEQTGYGLYRLGTVWTWTVEMVQTTTTHFQTVPHPYTPCAINTISVPPMSSLYLISTTHIQTVPYSIAKFQSVHNLYSP